MGSIYVLQNDFVEGGYSLENTLEAYNDLEKAKAALKDHVNEYKTDFADDFASKSKDSWEIDDEDDMFFEAFIPGRYATDHICVQIKDVLIQ